ncbi:hypothetical protein [Lacticaseibacillus pantheris]
MSADWHREYDNDALLFGLLTGIKPIPDVAATKPSLPQTGTQAQEHGTDANQSVTHK